MGRTTRLLASRKGLAALALALAAVAALLVWHAQRVEKERRARVVEALERAEAALETGRPAEAVQILEMLLRVGDLEPDERADVRFRLARAKIAGEDLQGALGVLHELATEDVGRLRFDLGPLYLELAEKARRRGDVRLALLANREGTGVSPARVSEFMEQRERIASSVKTIRIEPGGTGSQPNDPAGAPGGAEDGR